MGVRASLLDCLELEQHHEAIRVLEMGIGNTTSRPASRPSSSATAAQAHDELGSSDDFGDPDFGGGPLSGLT